MTMRGADSGSFFEEKPAGAGLKIGDGAVHSAMTICAPDPMHRVAPTVSTFSPQASKNSKEKFCAGEILPNIV
jgi:hypothetical protein